MKHIVLIDLDVILDTRAGVLFQHNPEAGNEIYLKGFRSRRSEEVTPYTNKITQEEFETWYKNRNAETLQFARPTNFIFQLADMVKELTEGIVTDTSRIDDAGIVINIHPYSDLTEQERIDIIYALQLHLGTDIPIMIADYPHDKLGLQELKEMEVLTYALYDIASWFNANFNEKKGRASVFPYPKLTIIAPQVLSRENSLNVLTPDDLKLLKEQSPFDLLRIYWSPIMGLQFCPIEVMSLIDTTIIPRPKRRPTASDSSDDNPS